ncbi:MAG: PEP-CTERM sorting domain-containing protein [Nitrosomonas sp.]|nr:PEP-CTERM sorting domain-containing protein [Nitrosomonas sp.]
MGGINWRLRHQQPGADPRDRGYPYSICLSPISAVPEPGAYMMLLAGLGFLGFSARRRKESAV